MEKGLNDQLIERLGQKGYAARVVSAARARDLRDGIEEGHENGLLDEAVYQRYLNRFVQEPDTVLPGAKSLVIVAARQPAYRFTFSCAGRQVTAIVPPTYLHNGVTDGGILKTLSEVLAENGHKAVRARVPNKLLAARSGLAAYGRNNIVYVPGMGSFHRLCAFFTDMICDGPGSWQEPALLDRCKNCRICVKGCPSGAIGKDRFQLHTENCITYHNEMDSDVHFPAWMGEAWHNSLVGCMRCQSDCPANSEFIGQIEDGAAFSEAETGLLLAGVPKDRLPASMALKLDESDLASIPEVLPRNLRILLRLAGCEPVP